MKPNEQAYIASLRRTFIYEFHLARGRAEYWGIYFSEVAKCQALESELPPERVALIRLTNELRLGERV